MIFRFLRRSPSNTTIQALYGAIVAHARLPSFYISYGVPDTAAGRFDMIVLHLVLLARRLEAGEGAVGQGVFDVFCQDLDANLREMGVGDLAVPRQMHDMAGAYYGRRQAYCQVLAAGDRSGCARALARNVFGEAAPGDGAVRLADYMFAAAAALDRAPLSAIARGDVRFPDPSPPR